MLSVCLHAPSAVIAAAVRRSRANWPLACKGWEAMQAEQQKKRA